MCDYSLSSVASRPAKAGDKLVATAFDGTATRGLTASADPNCAVCLEPGTEVEVAGFGVAVFTRVNAGLARAHHDAFLFPNSHVEMVTNLDVGTAVVVLQLPASGKPPIQQIDDGAEPETEMA